MPLYEQSPEAAWYVMEGAGAPGTLNAIGGDGASIADYFSLLDQNGAGDTAGWSDILLADSTSGAIDDAALAALPVDWEVVVPVAAGVTVYLVAHTTWDSLFGGASQAACSSDPGWSTDFHWDGSNSRYIIDALPEDLSGGCWSSWPGGWSYASILEDPSLCGGYSGDTLSMEQAFWQQNKNLNLGTWTAVSSDSSCDGHVRYATDAQLDRQILTGSSVTVATSNPGKTNLLQLNPCNQSVTAGEGGSYYGSHLWTTGRAWVEPQRGGSCIGTIIQGMDTTPGLATAVEQQIQSDYGTTTATIPSCDGMTYDQCVRALRAAGFLGWIYDDPTGDPGIAGNVEAVDPAVGTSAWVYTDISVETYGDTSTQEAPAPGDGPDSGGSTTGTTSDTALLGSPFTCPNIDVGAIDFTPLSGLNFGNAFPFGAVLWAKNGVSGWDTGGSSAPSVSIPLLGSGQGHPIVADLSILDAFMVTFREFVLMSCTFGLIWFLATTAFGFKDWGVGEQGSLF